MASEQTSHVNDMPLKYRWLFLTIMISPAFLIIRDFDSDLWFILNYGRYVLSKGFPIIDPFTLHEQFSFIMQQWLSGVIFWLAYNNFGSFAVFMLIGLVFALTLIVIYKLAMLVSGDYFFVSFAVTMFSAMGLRAFMVTCPYIFSTLVLLIELYCMELYVYRNNRKILLILPVLSMVLVNLHAAMWPMFLIVCLPWLIDAFRLKIGFIEGQGYSCWPLLFSMLASFAAAFINPYGLSALTYVFRSYGHQEINAFITEMMPFDLKTASGMFFYSYLAIALSAYFLDKTGTTRLRYVLLTCGLLILALSSTRNLMLFAGLVPFTLAYYLHHHADRKKITSVPSHQRMRILIVRSLLIALVLILIFEIFYFPNRPKSNQIQTQALNNMISYLPPPENAGKLVLYTGYNDGAYLEFQGYRPYIDARAEVFVLENNHQKDVMKEYYQLQVGQLHYREFLKRYNFTHLLLGRQDILRAYLAEDRDYQLITTGGDYQLYVKR